MICQFNEDLQTVFYLEDHLCYVGPLSGSSDRIQKYVSDHYDECVKCYNLDLENESTQQESVD